MAYIAAATAEEDEGRRAAPETLPPELRHARRAAAAALVVSAVTFAVVATMAARTFLGDAGPHSAAVAQQDVVGFSALPGRLDGPHHAPPLRPAAHRVSAASAVYLERSVASKRVRDLPVGSMLYPIRSKDGWVEVVVPPQDGQPAAMGWAPAPGGLAASFQPEPHAPRGRGRAAPAAPPTMSQEELRSKWEQVRARNSDVKDQLKVLQADMKKSYTDSIKDAGGRAGLSVVHGAEEALEMQGLERDAAKLGQEVRKELKAPPKKLLSDLERMFK